MTEVVRLTWPAADAAADAVAPAFEDVYWPLYLRAFRLSYRIVGNKQEAEDMAAEALARAHLHWRRVGPLPYRDAWVLRVASNLSRSLVRRRRRAAEAGPAPRPFDEAVVVRAAVEAAVSTLPRRQREAIALRYLAGLDISEIASCLGISAESTRTHIRRGLSSLRAQLTREDDLALD